MDADPRDQRIQELEAENAQLRETIRQLQERVEELERQAHRQAAPFRRPEHKRKPPEQHRAIGRPKGHPPAYRPIPNYVDEEVEVPLPECPQCKGPLRSVEPCEQFIEDLPPVRPHVTRLVTYTGSCPRCGEVRSTSPLQVSTATGAAKTHLGPRVLSLATLLNKQFGLTMRRACQVLRALGGLSLTPGGLTQALHRVARKSKGLVLELAAGLRCQPAVYADETSWWEGGEPRWLWTFTTPERTLYRVKESRGRDVVLENLGAHFAGVLVSDCLASYEDLPYIMHKCYGHHLKAIAQARDRKPEDQRAYFHELIQFLRSAMMLDKERLNLPPPEVVRIRQHLDQRADTLLLPSRLDPEEERIANRLRKRRQWLFTFLDRPGVEATNNRAERALRPAVIARKLSCGTRPTKAPAPGRSSPASRRPAISAGKTWLSTCDPTCSWLRRQQPAKHVRGRNGAGEQVNS